MKDKIIDLLRKLNSGSITLEEFISSYENLRNEHVCDDLDKNEYDYIFHFDRCLDVYSPEALEPSNWKERWRAFNFRSSGDLGFPKGMLLDEARWLERILTGKTTYFERFRRFWFF